MMEITGKRDGLLPGRENKKLRITGFQLTFKGCSKKNGEFL